MKRVKVGCSVCHRHIEHKKLCYLSRCKLLTL